MIPNSSPWLRQLSRTRPIVPLGKDVKTDIAVVGGGIAGVVTAYYALKDTNKKVLLIEADKIAHGATGHNAGQIVSYFEKSLPSLVEEFGFDLAVDGQRSVESAWQLLEEIFVDTKLQTPYYTFTGYAGLSELDQVILHLKSSEHRHKAGLFQEAIIISEEWKDRHEIPKKYENLYTVEPQKYILDLLETKNKEYIAVLSYKKGCMNSALFAEELVGYLLATYKDRFALFENTSLKIANLEKNGTKLEVEGHTIDADRLVLCTNGFENFSINNNVGPDINTEFHHSISGRIGYMAGYIEPLNHPPVAISYFPATSTTSGDPTGEVYFLLTRRPHEHEGIGEGSHNLVCLGGPEKVLPNGATYSRAHACEEDMQTLIDDFLSKNYNKHKINETEYSFCWHGLMGYTPNGIRRIGPEPVNPVLLYNLGCNGVGILPSIYGGKRIARYLNGESVPPSIFDPHDQTAK